MRKRVRCEKSDVNRWFDILRSLSFIRDKRLRLLWSNRDESETNKSELKSTVTTWYLFKFLDNC